MQIRRFLTPYMQSYTYLISEGKEGIIIDPCKLDDVEKIISYESIRIKYVILTHEHYDHISGLEWFQKQNIPIIASDICNINLSDSKKNQSRYYEAFCILQKRLEGDPIPKVDEFEGHADITFKDEYVIKWRSHILKLFKTPGHSEGSICIELDNTYLFSGDALFENNGYNAKLLGACEKDFINITIPKIKQIKENLYIYPGHYNGFYLKDWINNYT